MHCDTFPKLQSWSRKSRVGHVDPVAPSRGCMPLQTSNRSWGVRLPQVHNHNLPVLIIRRQVGRPTLLTSDHLYRFCYRTVELVAPGTGAIWHSTLFGVPSPLPTSIHCNSWIAISASTKLPIRVVFGRHFQSAK